MGKTFGSESWGESFGKLDLHSKVVGDSCVNWSHDHQIAIGTERKVVLCDMSMLIGGKKLDEIGFMIEDLPVTTDHTDYDVGIGNFLTDFEAACLKPSNVKACPDYDVYKIFLDPTLCDEKKREYKGYKSVVFSPPACSKVSTGELLSVLSLDHCLEVYEKCGAGSHMKWKLYTNLTSILIEHLKVNDGYFENHSMQQNSSKFLTLKEKKYSSSLCCASWSDVYELDGKLICFLAGSTKNGFVVVWRFDLPVDAQSQPAIVDVFHTNLSDIVTITFRRNISDRAMTAVDSFSLSLAASSNNGQIWCVVRTSVDQNKWVTSSQQTIWTDVDRLSPKKLHWISCDAGSLVLAAKSHILVAMTLDDKVKVVEEFILQDVHAMPIKELRIVKEEELKFISCSSDGLIVSGTITISPDLELSVNDIIGNPTDIGSYTGNSPSIMHGIALSPNKAFMAILTSRPQVKLSIQVDNIACLTLKRLITPQQAAQCLLQMVNSELENNSLYEYLDVIELVRQHFAMQRRLDDSLESFLQRLDVSKEYKTIKLQLRWHLLKLKEKVKKLSRRNATLECLSAGLDVMVDDSKNTEEVLTIRQMMKVVTAWFHESSNFEDCAVQIAPLVSLLGTKTNLLNSVEVDLLKKIESDPAYRTLPTHQICIFTGSAIEMAANGRAGVTDDGSSWPLCCLTFTALQGYEKRKCGLSGLFAAVPSPSNPAWLNKLLTSTCIFSGAPLAQYIN